MKSVDIKAIDNLDTIWEVAIVSSLSDGPIYEFRRIGWDAMKQPGVAITVYRAGSEEMAWKMLAETLNSDKRNERVESNKSLFLFNVVFFIFLLIIVAAVGLKWLGLIE